MERFDLSYPLVVTPAPPDVVAEFWEAMPQCMETFDTWFLLVPPRRTDD